MKNSKTFRLFISSTFDDFRREREILQTTVFPEIKKYCSDKGYRFQPIDLRWGISEEAQLDQKTLELCLQEVRACKTYPHPNFLFMLGDRYGWIPLPYCIEEKEFEDVVGLSSGLESNLLKEWYKLDYNQLPTSYILKPREGEFMSSDKWANRERKLLKILQSAVNKSGLTLTQKHKYFTSATAAEIEEGIISFSSLTNHQKTLLQEDSSLDVRDAEYIFGFLRNIDLESRCSDKFISDDYQLAQYLKEDIRELLPQNNFLECQTTQIDSNSLEETYLKSFEQKAIKFLKDKLQKQIKKDEKFSEFEVEKKNQEYFAEQKRANFVGQEAILEKIATYISNDERQPFVLHGKSGSGKSAILAKAISDVKKDVQVIFRFIGATSNSSSTTSVLTSIMKELGVETKLNTIDKTESNFEKETFEEFCERIKEEILNLKNETLIFIDAVDQFTNNDQFLWLPEVLPPNIKIVLSALEDEAYIGASSYYEYLSRITTNTLLVSPFTKPQKLLLSLLELEHRTLQSSQIDYFLEQYKSVQTPLYVYVTAQIVKHWTSSELVANNELNSKNDNSQLLPNSQKGIIEKFIDNLSGEFHHDRTFVQKVLSYIYASKDGLSENEILELVSTDSSLVKRIAPDTWHYNASGLLPVVIWARLFTQLKLFLNTKSQNNEDLLSFFHREFFEVIGNKSNHKQEHIQLIDSTQKLIIRNQNESFEKSRWGILFSNSLAMFSLQFSLRKNSKWFSIFKTLNKSFTESLIHWNLERWDSHSDENSINTLIAYKIAKIKFQLYPDKWAKAYSFSCNDLAFSLSISGREEEALILEKEALAIRQKMYSKSPNEWLDEYNTSLVNISQTLSLLNNTDDAILYIKKSIRLVKKLFESDPENWTENYVIALQHIATYYNNINNSKLAVRNSKLAKSIMTEAYEQDSEKWFELYYVSLRNLSDNYLEINQVEESLKLSLESLALISPYFLKDNKKWVRDYITSLNNIALVLNEFGRFKESLKYQSEAFQLVEKQYHEEPEKWCPDYIRVINNLNSNNPEIDLINLLEKSKSISEKNFHRSPQRWQEYYVNSLLNLGTAYLNNGHTPDKVFYLFEEAMGLLESIYSENPYRWIENYVACLDKISNAHNRNLNHNEAIKISQKAFDTIKPYYKADPERWVKEYLELSHSLAYSYSLNNDLDLSLELDEESLEITSKLYRKNKEVWSFVFAQNLHDLAYSYKISGKLNEAIVLEKKVLKINRALYNSEPYENEENLFSSINNLAYSYSLIGNTNKARLLYQESYRFMKSLFSTNRDYWLENFVTATNNLAESCGSNSQQIELHEDNLRLLKKVYRKNATVWLDNYTGGLRNLANAYKVSELFKKAVSLEKKALKLLREAYHSDNDKWAEALTLTMNNLAFSFQELKDYEASTLLEKEAISILKLHFDKNPSYWVESYFTALNNLGVSFRNQEKYNKSLLLHEQAIGVLEPFYKKDKERWEGDYLLGLENLQKITEIMNR